jgi:two-component system response regulator DesR
MARLLLVEDHVAFREALALLLDLEPDLEVAAQFGDPTECRASGRPRDVDVALLALPDGGGARLVGRMRGAAPGAKVLALAAGPEDTAEALGADGLLCKTASLAEIAAGVRRLAGTGGREGVAVATARYSSRGPGGKFRDLRPGDVPRTSPRGGSKAFTKKFRT